MTPQETITRLGQVVREEREKREWNQTELASRADSTQAQISDIEHGKKDIKLSTILSVAKALDIEAHTLMRKAAKSAAFTKEFT